MINRRKINLFDDVYFLLLVLQFYFVFLLLRLLRLLLSVIIVWVDFFTSLIFLHVQIGISLLLCTPRENWTRRPATLRGELRGRGGKQK